MTTIENSSNSSNAVSGNTKQKQPSPSINWCFTWNNYPMNYKDLMDSSISSKILMFCIGEEIGAEGTPHLQGCIKFIKKGRPTELNWPKQIHWEKCKGSWLSNLIYCAKQGKYWTNDKIPTPVKDPLKNKKLYAWQADVINIIKSEPDDRSIYWYYEEEGNTGKSTLVKHICMNYNAICVSGKGADMKYAVSEMKIKPDIILIDIPRTSMSYVSYTGIEEIKNGCFFCGKYESKQVIMNSPNIICFSNSLPDISKVSKDRWKIYEIDDKTSVEISVDDILKGEIDEPYELDN